MARRFAATALLPLLTLALPLLITACAPSRAAQVIRMQEQIESLLELHTYEHIYRDLVYFGEERSFLGIPTVDRALLFSVDIRVRAGMDLAEGVVLTADRTSASRIYVRLPNPEILTVDADESSIREYFIREKGGSVGLLELSGQLEGAKARTAEEAVRRGILEQADANARRIVRGFLNLAGFSEVVFASPSTGDEDDAELRG